MRHGKAYKIKQITSSLQNDSQTQQAGKGQSISKENFGASSILPKDEHINVNFCPSLLGQKVFISIFGVLKKPKSPIEIN